MSTRIAAISADQAPLPNSIPTVQRPLPGEIVYPFFTRVGDWFAGRHDTRLLQAMLDKQVELGITPWMKGLRSGFLTSVARDRRETIALQAPLRDEAAHAIARFKILEGKAASLKAAVQEERASEIDSQPSSAGEAYDKPDQVLRRRQKEADARLAAARSKVVQSEVEREHIVSQVAQLKEGFDFHEEAHVYRVEALRDFYTKRQSVYVRHGLRNRSNDGVAPMAPDIDTPNWQAAAFPSIADIES